MIFRGGEGGGSTEKKRSPRIGGNGLVQKLEKKLFILRGAPAGAFLGTFDFEGNLSDILI